MKQYELRRAIRTCATWKQRYPCAPRTWGMLLRYATTEALERIGVYKSELDKYTLIKAYGAHRGQPYYYAKMDRVTWSANPPLESRPLDYFEISPVLIRVAYSNAISLNFEVGKMDRGHIFIWPKDQEA